MIGHRIFNPFSVEKKGRKKKWGHGPIKGQYGGVALGKLIANANHSLDSGFPMIGVIS
jgi:hypothetical protein